MKSGRMICRLLGGLFVAAWVAVGDAKSHETAISADEFKRLDPFEGHVLAKADQAFAKKDYRVAVAAYDAFLLQYPKSVAVPYAILRKGRGLQLDNKRFEAIKVFNEVLDYFPTALPYAGAALYQIGACHWDSGEVEQALKAWTEMAQDKDYRTHPLAAGAIEQLADNLKKQGKLDEANAYYRQVALDFRKTNPESARSAISKVVWHHVRAKPDVVKLREFYEKVGTFDPNPIKPDERNFWQRVRENVRGLGNFPDTEKDQRNRYYQYWTGVMEGKQPDWDDFQIDLADFKRVFEGDVAKWAERLDRQFNQYQKPGDYARVVKWLRLFRESKPKVQEYYAKLDFTKMSGPLITELLRISFDEVRDVAMARSVFDKLRFDQMPDGEKCQLGRYFWSRDEGLTERVAQSITDQDRGRMELLRYYQFRANSSKGLPLAEEMIKNPATAKEAFWIKAELLQKQGRLLEAVVAYQSADNPPQNLWKIVDCYLGLKKRDQALAQLREIENFFKDQAPEAALRIAHLQRDGGERKQYIAGLRGVMKKYPKSGQSSAAHQELERLGVQIGGGVDAD